MEKKDYNDIENDAVLLAEKWQQKANKLLLLREKVFQKKFKKLISNDNDKLFLNRMIDRCFRSKNNTRISDQVYKLMKRFGTPSFFSLFERSLSLIFLYIARHLPFVTIPIMIKRMRYEFRDVILPEEEKLFLIHLGKRQAEGVRMNLNHLGEAILGEKQALFHLETYINDLNNPKIENISVKISTIYSQILPIAFDTATEVIGRRLAKLYTAMQNNIYIRADGKKVNKFVNLDMEEFKDLEITAKAFTQTLDLDEFQQCFAGIALQAYLPDSFNVQKEITEWAKKRVARGGSPVKIRLVKGANLEMEKFESSIRNWSTAPFNNKLDVDANFKCMVEYGLRPENIKAVHIGLGSHNLFDLAWASLLASNRNVAGYLGFEMLEGMADHIRRAMMETGQDMLLYAPVTSKEQFTSAIAYLVRRIDENTGDENFLRYICNLKPGTENWHYLKNQFKTSLKRMESVKHDSHRIQNRATEIQNKNQGTFHHGLFRNEPDTDWSLAANRAWADSIRLKWQKSAQEKPDQIPVVISGLEIFENRKKSLCYDRSVNDNESTKICVAEYMLADKNDVTDAIETAKNDPDEWRKKNLDERHEILSKVADEIRNSRGDLIGAAALGTGKIFTETDVEISEAIDFAEYYPWSMKAVDGTHNLMHRGKGVGLVISPWNFPVAIPCGGIVAALSAGNTVIFKPASAAVLPAWHLCQCFWRAGVSKNVLQFLPCRGDKTGALLAGHPDIDFIIFTGGTDTGLSILKKAPVTYFAGETGGKNAIIVTAMADRDQAVKNIVHSAFSNAGQKCSATSLLILEKEVFEDIDFRTQLVDAAGSLKTGSNWEFETRVGPLTNTPGESLRKALKTIKRGEEWALEPENINSNQYLWSPGIKWGIKPGSSTHMTEFFGPVLGVMCANNLEHAIGLVNQTGYGLTSGLESLDEDEQAFWKENIKAGNLYINRGTTGAVVLRQPFGGMGKSAIGCGLKAGGPNYVLQFIDFQDTDLPVTGAIEKKTPLLALMDEWWERIKNRGFGLYETDIIKTIAAVENYHYAFEREFSKESDFFHLRGQDNIVKYMPVGTVVIRIHEKDNLFETLARIAATIVTGCKCIISIPESLDNKTTSFLKKSECLKFTEDARVISQKSGDLISMIDKVDRIRYAAPDRIPAEIYKAAAAKGFYISRSKVLMEGRIELVQYLREQSISCDYHRYGNLGERSDY